MSSSQRQGSGSSADNGRNANSGPEFKDLFDQEVNKNFAVNFQYDVSLPAISNSLKLLNNPVDMSVFLNPLSSFELGDLQTAALPDFEAPIIDLISRFGRERIGYDMNNVEEEAAEDLDSVAKKPKRDMPSLRAPTHTAVEFIADDVAADRTPVVPDFAPVHVNQRKTYSVEECFTRSADSYSHPLKPTVTAATCFALTPEGRMPSNPNMRMTPVAFDTDPVLEDPLSTKNATYKKQYPKLVIAPLPGQEFTSIYACQMFGDVHEQRVSRGVSLTNPRESMRLTAEDEALLGDAPVTLMPRMRVYQSMTQKEVAQEQTVLLSLSKDHAGLTLLNPRVQLTKATQRVQQEAKKFPDAIAVTRLPKETQVKGSRAPAKIARPLLSSALAQGSPYFHPASQPRRLQDDLEDEEEDFFAQEEQQQEEDEQENKNQRQGGRLRGAQDSDEEIF